MTRIALLCLLLGLTACNEECVDQFDCLRLGSKTLLTCDDGRCVVKMTAPTFNLPMPVRDAGTPPVTDGGAPTPRLVPGDYTARISGSQQVPPVMTMGSGTATVTLRASDAGTYSIAYSVSVTGVQPVNVALMLGAPAGRQSMTFLRLNDGGVPVPLVGTLDLSRTQAEAISGAQSAIIVTSATRPFGELRGQVIPRGAILGFTQLVRSRDGQYGGGGQLVLETDGGFIPTAGSFLLDWTESGPVANAAVTRGGTNTPILSLPLNAARTGAEGTFDPFSLLLMLGDAGVSIVGSQADGGETFRGDLSLSLR